MMLFTIFFYMKIKSVTNETWYDSGSYRVVAYSMIFYNRLFSYI